MSETAKVLQAMLTENTGTHMLDSGGAYGRGWQRNAGRDFDAEPAATISVREGYIDIRRSTYHFLVECLEFDEAMNDRFQAFNRKRDPGDQIPWLALMEEFAESIEARGIYGEGPPITANTYNHDSLLDQIIQYVYFEIDETGYVLLQIHGGCDARGGYTAPKAFRCNIEHSPSLFDDATMTITCKSGHRWYGWGGGFDTDHEDDDNEFRSLDKFPIVKDSYKPHPGAQTRLWRSDTIWQDSGGVHCPLCSEILEVW